MEEILYEGIDDRIINFAAKFQEKYDGLKLLEKVYKYIKNDIYFDSLSKSEKTCDVLVFGSGDNKSKNQLLCTVIKLLGFECYMVENDIKNNSKLRFGRKTNRFIWYSVKVKFLGREILLDATFDKLYLVSNCIIDRIEFGQDQVKKYTLRNENIELFNVNSVNVICEKERYMKVKFSYAT